MSKVVEQVVKQKDIQSLKAAIKKGERALDDGIYVAFDWRTLSNANNPQPTIKRAVREVGYHLDMFGYSVYRDEYYLVVRED